MKTKKIKYFLFFSTMLVSSQSTNISGPAGSGKFGNVVTDPNYDEGATVDVGAVYLYNGSTNALISTLKGSNTNDRVGWDVVLLTKGNFVVRSYSWNGNRGAAT
jgi:hypothetical protein